jgi:hypothetical protein
LADHGHKVGERGNGGMAEGSRSDRDTQFALDLAEELQGSDFTLESVQRPYVDWSADRNGLLHQIEQRVGRYTDREPNFLSERLRQFFFFELEEVRRVCVESERGEILMLGGLGNGFNLYVVVNIFNYRARRALEALARDERFREDRPSAPKIPISAPTYSLKWARSLEDRGVPVQIASSRDAITSFLALITDSLRFVAISGSGSGAGATGGSGSGFPFTANCNLHGWILESWPQYKYSPVRFGSAPTSPVPGSLPTSGNYFFQGRKGSTVRMDTTPHYASTSNNSTIVRL